MKLCSHSYYIALRSLFKVFKVPNFPTKYGPKNISFGNITGPYNSKNDIENYIHAALRK